MNQNAPTEAIQKLFLLYIGPMKIRNDDSSFHKSAGNIQPPPSVQSDPTNLFLLEKKR
jgi:hypothetical protein